MRLIGTAGPADALPCRDSKKSGKKLRRLFWSRIVSFYFEVTSQAPSELIAFDCPFKYSSQNALLSFRMH